MTDKPGFTVRARQRRHLRVGDHMPRRLQAIASVLWPLGIALNLILALSPLWHWHTFLGWGATLVLLTFAWDERRGIRAALGGRGRRTDRLFACFLLTAAGSALLVNAGIAIAATRAGA